MLRKMQVPSLPLLAVILLAASVVEADQDCDTPRAAYEGALVRLAANHLDTVLGAVADSVTALGHTYARLTTAQGSEPPADPGRWLDSRTTVRNTTGVRTWPADLAAPPAFQAPYPGFYSFSGEALSDAVLRQFDLFKRLVPTFRSAYESFPFSWVYITTADDAMMIYPYVPIDEAVNDEGPSETIYYRAAAFTGHKVGWTQPYLDLVGAGMMVTASYPVYEGDTLLGVMSRDITLEQLAASVLTKLGVDGASALIIAPDGLAIAASDAKLAHEIDRVNTKAARAVLYYRTERGMQTLSAKDAVTSESAQTNALVERLLAEPATADDSVLRFELDGKRVLAAPVAHTGWLVVLMLTEPAS